MGILSQLWVEIGSDKTKLDSGLIAAKAQITDFAAKSNSLLGALGVGVGGAGLARFLADATKKGSDLNETLSKTKQVFGDASGVVTAMADDMATKFGSVKGVTLDAAANLGLVAQGAGMSADQAANLATKLTRLADDASSFYNVPLDVALEKIRSGLVGEAEPLRAFGVLLSEDAVKQQALAMGLKTTSGELTEQEKVMARVELITKGLNKAQGDHSRTIGEYASQIRQLKGEWENFQTEIGSRTAPVATDVLVGRRIQKALIEEKGVLGALWTDLAAGFSSTARADIVRIGTEAIAGPAMYQPNPRPDTGPIKESAEDFLHRTATQDVLKEYAAAQFEKKKFTGGGFGAFGMLGDLGNQLNQQAMAGTLDTQIREQRAKMSAWGGAHVMDSESFMRQAQERILKPEDETQKQQLAELVKAREGIDKLVGKQEGRQKVGGVILRGRES